MGSSLLLLAAVLLGSSEEGKHLFILSGQSNMAGLNPDLSFTPAVAKAFGKDRVIVVKDAVGGQPIRRWYKAWKPENGKAPDKTGDLYDRLMGKVRAATKDIKLASVTFVWMQGERDAREKHGTVYAASLAGLITQVREDLKRPDVNVVIGRLSDFDMANRKYPHWTMVRKAQIQVVEEDARAAWVDTDDLNDVKGKNDLHYARPEGYRILGDRFAEKAIALVKAKGKK